MMKRVKTGFLILLAIYSLALLYTEFTTSQDYVRHYFTDIEGPVRLYAINTTISTFFLWAIALIFAICIMCLGEQELWKKTHYFYLSQIIIFLYLGFDDRFKLHEEFAWRLGIVDTYILLVVGVVEAFLLRFLGDVTNQPKLIKSYLFTAIFFFVIMACIDAFLPERMMLRLSFEDLFKTWADVFLFMFAWEICHRHIAQIKYRDIGEPHLTAPLQEPDLPASSLPKEKS